MGATSLRKKKLDPVNVQRYIYSYGTVGKTKYTSTFSMDKKKVITFKKIENGKISINKYRLEGKRFSYVSN